MWLIYSERLDIMIILGLGGSNHDFSACIVKDGEILCMIEDERITRKKHGVGIGLELAKGFSRRYCCESLGIGIDDFDLIVANDILNNVMYKRLNKKTHLINHHVAHAASCYYPSPFNESAILIVDAVGSKRLVDSKNMYDTISFGIGNGNKLDIIENIVGKNIEGTDYVENSLGIFYSIITDIIGFGEHQEGKTMGLAPYGTNKYYKMLNKHVRQIGYGNIEIGKKDIEELLSYKEIIDSVRDEQESFYIKADFAWAAQTILEENLIYLCKHLKKITGLSNLCIAGGIALNSVSNYKIYRQKIFERVFIQPACGDNGTSIGSALYGYYSMMNMFRNIEECLEDK